MKKTALFLISLLLLTLLFSCAKRESVPHYLEKGKDETDKLPSAGREPYEDIQTYMETQTIYDPDTFPSFEEDYPNSYYFEEDEATVETKWQKGDYKDEHYEYLLVEGEYYEVVRRFDYSVKTIKNIPSEINGIPVKSIGGFFGDCCRTLESVTLPESITILKPFSFFACGNLKNIVLPEGLVEIGAQSFIGCAFSSIEIPSTVTKIGPAAFQNCENLELITLPYGLIKIENGLFGMCENLKSVTIQNSVKSIDGFAFNGCLSLETVYFIGSEEEFSSITIDRGNEAFINARVVFINPDKK